MDAEQIFQWANLLILPGWLLLVLLPRHSVTARLVLSGAYSSVYAAAYLVLILLSWNEVSFDFSNLAAVQTLFQNPTVLLAGWIHYLAFDLFIGAWALRDSWQHGIKHWLMLPVLLLSFNLGPIGLLLYISYKFYYLKLKT